MKSLLTTVFVVIFVLVAVVTASGDAQAKADGEKVAEMGIGTVVNTLVVMAKATVGAVAGVGGDTGTGTATMWRGRRPGDRRLVVSSSRRVPRTLPPAGSSADRNLMALVVLGSRRTRWPSCGGTCSGSSRIGATITAERRCDARRAPRDDPTSGASRSSSPRPLPSGGSCSATSGVRGRSGERSAAGSRGSARRSARTVRGGRGGAASRGPYCLSSAQLTPATCLCCSRTSSRRACRLLATSPVVAREGPGRAGPAGRSGGAWSSSSRCSRTRASTCSRHRSGRARGVAPPRRDPAEDGARARRPRAVHGRCASFPGHGKVPPMTAYHDLPAGMLRAYHEGG